MLGICLPEHSHIVIYFSRYHIQPMPSVYISKSDMVQCRYNLCFSEAYLHPELCIATDAVIRHTISLPTCLFIFSFFSAFVLIIIFYQGI
jgi:hypothetical protein